ncbi:hypothetical protein ASPSYDRAFT_27976 [Aspergillus sydowii CBS 593.65]|uniref:NAD(P)-binding protein n=1 Tax=Aspergillus sydowii CBS 593.65 TaxID=1036612 RepID=A0A1L9TSA7_9EURO|nr:uncharacterized protein ASPSYDRAFT_27976 [Aspergillus sydowii CBS 593.65]OJJ62330.1 hypothetical protein ASPSYDRAFT_27976 [Aspergillus sydowii CBS 593.65]
MDISGIIALLRTKLTLPSPSEIKGKTVLITGGNTGLGREAARHALSLGAATVILGVRTLSKGEDAKSDIESSTGKTGRVLVWPVDLESFASVNAFADRVKEHVADGGRLDIAIMNAGLASMEWAVTEDGWESDIHRTAKFEERTADNILSALNDRIQGEKSQSTGGAGERYAVSKLLDIFLTTELARLAPRDESGNPLVIVNCLTPGFCKSDLLTREKAPLLLRMMQTAVARTVEEGSKTFLHAATQGNESHGLWLEHQAIADPGKNVTTPAQRAVGEKIWGEVVAVLKEVDSGIPTEY